MNFQSYNDFLPQEILTSINQQISEKGWHYGWRSRSARDANIPYSHWNIELVPGSSENGLDVSTELAPSIAAAWDYVKTNYAPDAALVRCYANGHTYGVEGYPHTDSIRAGDQTILVYLNPEWKRDWGGETVFYDNDQIIHAELPKYNKAIKFNGRVAHVAKGVTRVCPTLRMTLMFKITLPEAIDPTRNRLQEFLTSVNTDSASHSANTLTGHLLRTYDLLKHTGHNQDVCNAGAVHSLFGTSIFKWENRLSYDEAFKIAEVAGEKATKLAEIFSKIYRPGILESNIGQYEGKLLSIAGAAIDVSVDDFNSLCALEAANLHDQNGLNNFPKLKQLWNELNTI